MAHLKRLTIPLTWPVPKKEHKWITRPNPGAHKLDESISLNIILKYMLKYASTTRETKKILTARKILVDNKPRTDLKFPLGLMDIIDIPETKEAYVVLLDAFGKFKLIPAKNPHLKYCKILNKNVLKGKKIQLNLSSGRNIIVDKDAYKTGDTIVIDLSTNKIKHHIKLEKDALVYITAGKHIGNIGKIIDIHKSKTDKDKIILSIHNSKYETLKDYAFVIDKDFEALEHGKSNETDKD